MYEKKRYICRFDKVTLWKLLRLMVLSMDNVKRLRYYLWN